MKVSTSVINIEKFMQLIAYTYRCLDVCMLSFSLSYFGIWWKENLKLKFSDTITMKNLIHDKKTNLKCINRLNNSPATFGRIYWSTLPPAANFELVQIINDKVYELTTSDLNFLAVSVSKCSGTSTITGMTYSCCFIWR
jgi:hypothetical protein